MATFSQAQRQALLDELSGMKFGRAKGKLARMDPRGRLVYYRNVQQSGEWHTKFLLEGKGIAVTLVEVSHAGNDQARNEQNFQFVNVIIEALDA
ncbi:MAG: hypothetical protein OXE46_11370 [Chloroflexi bacterium]|nr:hypothetical protein [Chloroflexota bacterium]